jgi:predicted NBD/HSP70 family sugar kinase
MSAAAMKYLLVRPRVPAPLDPNFSPVVLGKKKYLKYVSGSPFVVEWALERSDGVARGKLPVFADSHPDVDASVHLAGVLIQEMIWQRSAFRLLLCGPPGTCGALLRAFSPEGKYAFEVRTMPKVCGLTKAFEVRMVFSAAELPPPRDTPQRCGSDASGCRLAFDLGKSDIKTVAVQDNQVLHSKETEWDVTNPDPQYHWEMILSALQDTAQHLPRIDAIGGSATGTLSGDNGATWCDIFPNVPPEVYKEKVVPIFRNLAKKFGDVPLKVINDGEVTALAGKMMVNQGNLFGISMGSSEGGGYCDEEGRLLGWINEMCYIQLDLNPEAVTDPWTKGHTGISHMYLGQRGATKLVEKGGVDVPEELRPDHSNMNTMKHEGHAKCLKLIQAAMKDPAKEPQARKIYETVGVYLGYGLAQYSEHYKIENALILGRVSSGAGGDVLIAKAKEVLAVEFPDIPPIKFHFADEHFKRVGQCIAAAALPTL